MVLMREEALSNWSRMKGDFFAQKAGEERKFYLGRLRLK